MKKGILIVFIALFPFVCLAELNTNDSTRYIVQIGFNVTVDHSYDKSYELLRYAPNPWHYHDFLGYMVPTVGIGITTKKRLLGFPFRLNHMVGFHYAKQDYTGYYGASYDRDPHGAVINYQMDTETTIVKKYNAYYRIEAKVGVFDWFFVSPLLQADVRIAESLGDNIMVLKRLGAYDEIKEKLSNHPRLNLKYGIQAGFTAWNRFQIGVNMTFGMTKSITVQPDHKWRNNHGGVFLNVKL